MLYELLTGRPPYDGDFLQLMGFHTHAPIPRPSDLVLGLPAGFNDVIATGMAKDPNRRYRSAGELAAAAYAALDTPAAGPSRPDTPADAGPRQASIPTAIPPYPQSAQDPGSGHPVGPPSAARHGWAPTVVPRAAHPSSPWLDRPAVGAGSPWAPPVLIREPRPRRRWKLVITIAVTVVVLAGAGIGIGLAATSTGDMPSSFSGDWVGRSYAAPGTGVPQRAVTVTLDGGAIGGRVGLLRYPQDSCDYDLLLLSVRPEGELIAAITVQASRTLSSPMSCTDQRIELDDRDDELSGNFDTIGDLGPTPAYVELRPAS